MLGLGVNRKWIKSDKTSWVQPLSFKILLTLVHGEPTDAPHIDEGYRKFTTLFIAPSIFYQVSCKWEGIGTQLSSQGKSDHCIQKEQMPLHRW